MKLIIDVPEKKFIKDDLIHFFGCYSTKLDEVIKNGIPLDEMKNGEVIKTVFPKTKIRGENMNFINFTLDGIVGTTVEKDWWMTKYK